MEHPGEYLKRERAQRGVSLSKICESTRVPLKFLEALEADDYGALPHPTFVKGYIKSYCKCLGLDETDAVLRYELYLRENSDKSEHTGDAVEAKKKHYLKTSLKPVSFRKNEPSEETKKTGVFSNRKIVAGAASALVLITVAYFVSRKPGAPPAEVKNVPAAAVNAQQPAPPDQGVSAPAQTLAPSASTPAAVAVPGVPAAPVAADKAMIPADAKHLLTASAREMSWIKVTIDDDEPFDVVLRAGEKVSWKADKVFNIIVGNAGGVALNFDGEQMPSLGGAGEVVKIRLPKGTPPVKARKAKPAVAPPAIEIKPGDPKPAGEAAPATGVNPAAGEALKPAVKKAKAAKPASDKVKTASEAAAAPPARPEVEAAGGTPAANPDSAQPKVSEAPKSRWDTTPQEKFHVRPADETSD